MVSNSMINVSAISSVYEVEYLVVADEFKISLKSNVRLAT
jgi:hypothetical protein